MSNQYGTPKNRACKQCHQAQQMKLCPSTRIETGWTVDEQGCRSRSVSGGVCAKAEDAYQGEAAA